MQRVMYAAVKNAPMDPMIMNAVKSLWFALARISSFDQKPASGGMPTSAAVPIKNVMNVCGMYFRKPPMSRFMSKEWCEPEWATDPAPRKRFALKNA
jgi:hypothetical protein